MYKHTYDKHNQMQYGNTIYEKEYILQLMIKVISKCISFNRFESIQNINGKYLILLKRNFKPVLWKTREEKWTYLTD